MIKNRVKQTEIALLLVCVLTACTRDNKLGIHGKTRISLSPTQFTVDPNIAMDSHGNLYTAEVETGKRIQKFTPAGN